MADTWTLFPRELWRFPFSWGEFSVFNSTYDLDRGLLEFLRRDEGTAEMDIFFLFFVPQRLERVDGGLVSSSIISSLSCVETISVNFLGRAEIVASSSISWAGGKWAILSERLSNSPLSTVSSVVGLSIFVSLSLSFSFSSSLHVSSRRTLFFSYLGELLGTMYTSPLPDFKPWRTRYESVNYGISNYWSK